MRYKPFIYISLIIAAFAFVLIGCTGGGGDIETSNGGNGDGDATAPSVAAVLPTDGAADVSLNSNLVITFDEAVAIGTGNVNIYDSGDVLFEAIAVGSAQVTAAGNDRFAIDPTTDFTVSESYYVLIDVGAFKDASNNNFAGIADKTTWDFQAGAATDLIAPAIEGLFPADEAIDVPLNVSLVITFDEAVIPGTGYVSIYDSLDTPIEAIDVASSQVTGFGTDTIIVYPSSNFAASTDYYVQIDIGTYKDVANQNFTGIVDKVTWNFTTGLSPDGTPPSIWVLSPVDDAPDVLPTANLVITFDEAVVADAGNITIYDSGDALFEAIDVTSAQVTGSGTTTITIDPTTDFTELTNYYVLIDPGAFKDTANNEFAGITATTTWNFGVRDNTPPTIVKVYPVDGATAVPTNANLIIVFSEAVNVGSGFITVYDSVDVVDTIDVTSGQVTGAGTDTILIDRSDIINLSALDNHYIQIDAGAFVDTSPTANPFAGITDTTTWNFVTDAVADTDPPTVDLVTDVIPAKGAISVPLNSNLQITFDEVVFIDSGKISIYEAGYIDPIEEIDVSSAQVTGSWTDTIFIDPADFPTAWMFYWVLIDATAFYDISGNYFAGIADASWNFMTGSGSDTTEPSISTVSPSDDATDVTLISNLEIAFDETVYAGSGNISIYESDGTPVEQIAVVSAQVTGLGTANISIDPSSDFDGLTGHYVFIDATAFKDAANNYFAGITDPAAWSFTTEVGVLLTDPFAYGGIAGDLDTISTIWSEVIASTTQKVQYDNATGYSFTNYSSGAGGRATAQNDQDGGAMGQGFTVGAVTDDGALYYGFIVGGPGAAANTDTGPGILFYNGTTALGGISFQKRSVSNQYTVVLDAGGASTQTLKNNTTGNHLIVIRYDFTNNTLDGWFDPDVSLAEPAPDQTIDQSSSPWTNIDSVAIDQSWRGIVTPSNTYGIDEIKVVKSWGLLAEPM